VSEFELHIGVEVKLTQDNNGTEDEQKHSEDNWNNMLEELKKVVGKN